MGRTLNTLLLCCLLALPAGAQVVPIQGSDKVRLSRSTINDNFTWIDSNKVGYSVATTVPSSCSTFGLVFWKSDGAAGEKLYYCNGSTYEQVTSAAVASVFGRTGAVTAQAGDYAAHYAGLVHAHLIADVTGLQAALDGKAPSTHAHAADDVTSGTFTLARGGTNQNTWTGGRCVQVNSAGTALESAATACGGAVGSDVEITFTNQTTVVFVHNLHSKALSLGCRSTSDVGFGYGNAAYDTDDQVTFTFSPAASGTCWAVKNGVQGEPGAGGAGTWGAITGTLSDQTDLQSALDGKEPANANIQAHISNTSNPHAVTKAQTGLGSVENYAIASQAEAEAGTATDKYMNPLRTAQAIAALAAGGGHTQNTDTGTNSPTFQLDTGNSGPKIKNASGVLEVRTAADDAYADLKVRTLEVIGDGNPSETAEASAPAGSPSAGKLYVWADSTNKGQWSKDSSGNTYRDVRPTTATPNQFLTNIGSDGVQTKAQPAFSDLSGAATDAQVPNTITIDNITQITARAIGDTTGTLAVNRGGTGVTAAPDDNVMIGNGTAWQNKLFPNCNANTEKMRYDLATNEFICVTDQTGGNVSTGVTLVSGQLLVGAGTSAVGVGNLSGDVTTSGSTATELATKHKTRQFTFLLGADNGDVLTDDDDQKTIFWNRLGGGITITEVSCEVDGGTPSVNLQRNDGSAADILSSNLSCSTSGATSTAFTSGENAIANNHKIDFVMVAAGGTAKRATITVVYTVD